MYIEQIEKIEDVIKNYFEGIYYGDVKKLQKCFDQRVILYGDIDGEKYCKNFDNYIEGVKERKSPSDLGEKLKMKILGIEVLGNVAVAKLHVPMLGYNYYDFLSLTLIENEWKIVNKLFSNVA